MQKKIELNNEYREFVVSEGGGTSCLGYDVVYSQTMELAKRLRERGIPALNPSKDGVGTLKQYELYQSLFDLYRKVPDITTWFDARTSAAVQQALETLRTNRHKVRIFYGDTSTGRSWLDVTDVIGRLGRSGGPMKVPLLMVDKQGGAALLTHCVVRLVDLTTGHDAYRHPMFHTPAMLLEKADSEDRKRGYTHSVRTENRHRDMELARNFRSEKAAVRWMDFMSGEVHSLRQPRLAHAA
ncbi:hypothetical protein G3A43_06540 [Paraburkholderia aspalathi]|nr:hypothetical protein [Paraburkholderia aspalathi]MBK3779907.1 hypothetical protein [Paraburkholderia aspalathi]